MIDPHRQHRFDGDSGIDIASDEFDVVFADGERRVVKLRVGAPFKRDDTWFVRTELEGLDSTDTPFAGDTSLQALILGLRWIVMRMESIEKSLGCRYYWTDSNEAYDYRKHFATVMK